MTQERELIAPCGLYCGACTMYRAMTDKGLAEKLAQAMSIPVDKVGCPGCRPLKGQVHLLGGAICKTYDCCVSQRGLEFCYQCDDFPCLNLAPCADRANDLPHNFKVYNLVLLQKRGVEYLTKEARDIWRRYFRGKLQGAGPEL